MIPHFQKKRKTTANNKEKEGTYRKYLMEVEEEVKQRRAAVEDFNEVCYPVPVMGTTDAAFIKHTGRAYVAVHGESLEQVQILFSEAGNRNVAIAKRQSDCVIQGIKSVYEEWR